MVKGQSGVSVHDSWGLAVYCTGMVTGKRKGPIARIRERGTRRHLYIAEHMEIRGLDDAKLAGRLDVARETVTRWRNNQRQLNPAKVKALADALDIEPEDLWHPPGRPSVDARLKDAPDEVVRQFAEMAAIYTKRAANG